MKGMATARAAAGGWQAEWVPAAAAVQARASRALAKEARARVDWVRALQESVAVVAMARVMPRAAEEMALAAED